MYLSLFTPSFEANSYHEVRCLQLFVEAIKFHPSKTIRRQSARVSERAKDQKIKITNKTMRVSKWYSSQGTNERSFSGFPSIGPWTDITLVSCLGAYMRWLPYSPVQYKPNLGSATSGLEGT